MAQVDCEWKDSRLDTVWGGGGPGGGLPGLHPQAGSGEGGQHEL